MLLDIRTTIMIAAGLGLLVALSLRYVLRDYPAMLGPSMREWMLGVALQALSWALTEFRDSLPDFVTVVVSNALLSIGYALLVDAVRRFMGRAPGNRALVALVCISIGVQIFFTYAVPSTRLRILFGSLVFGSLLLFALRPLLDPRQPRRRAALLTACAFVVLLAVMLARFVHEALDATALYIALADMDDDLPALLRRADRAMYAAKNAGRNCVVGPQDAELAALPIGG